MNKIIKQTGYFNSFDETELYYEVRGQGEPIFFAYGIGCLFNHWIHQVKHFSKTNKILLLDYRAHNKSQVPADYDNLDLESIANDINDFFDHLGIESAHFVGHSFGAQVLLKCYDLFPHRFKSIIFINGFATNPIHGMFGSDLPHKAFEWAQKSFHTLPETTTNLWKTIISHPLSGPISALAGGFNLSLTAYKDIEVYSRAISQMDLKAFLTLFEGMIDYDGEKVLPLIKVPTLIIGGKKDFVTPTSHQMHMHEKIKNSDLCLIPYGSHCTQLDLPEYVNMRMEKFFFEHFGNK